MAIAEPVLLLLVFLLELAALAAYGYWGFHLDRGWLIRIGLGIGVPLLVAVVWGTFLAPKASIQLPLALRFLLKTAVFSLATAALYASGQAKLALAFGATVIVVSSLSYWLDV